jgi:hypothetical protein
LWLQNAHPAHESSASPDESRESLGKHGFDCAEQFMIYCKALFFHNPISGALILEFQDPAE